MPKARDLASSVNAGSIPGSRLENDAITASKMAANSVDSSELANDSVSTGKIQTGAVPNVKLAFDGGALGSRNRLINGDMRIWQRGTTLNGMTPTLGVIAYTADRWFVSQLISQSSTDVSQQTGGATRFSVRVQKRAGSTGASLNQLGQVVENLNCLDLPGKQLTLSFTAKAGANYSAAGGALGVLIYTCTTADQSSTSFVNGIAAGQATLYSGTVTLTASNQAFSITTSAVAANATNICVIFSENSSASAAGANDWFEISDVQIETGTVATPLEGRSHGQELALCQRYYQSMSLFVSSAGTFPYMFPVTKRSAPTVSSAAAGFSLATVTPTVDHFWCTQTTGGVITVTAASEL